MTAIERHAAGVPASVAGDNVIPFPVRRRPPAPPAPDELRRAMAVLAESDAALHEAAIALTRSAARLGENLQWLDRQAARAARIRDEAARIQAAIEAGALDVMLALADELRGRGDVGMADRTG